MIICEEKHSFIYTHTDIAIYTYRVIYIDLDFRFIVLYNTVNIWNNLLSITLYNNLWIYQTLYCLHKHTDMLQLKYYIIIH